MPVWGFVNSCWPHCTRQADDRVVVTVRVEGLFRGHCNPLGERMGISIRMVLVEMEKVSGSTLRRPSWQGLTQQH